MIPTMNIIAWGNNVPWVAQRQVEQDLIPGDDWKQTADMLKRFALKGRVLPPTGTILKGSI